MPSLGNTVRPIEVNELNKPVSISPKENRSCRDVVFFLLFLIVIGGMCYCSYVALCFGDPYRLVYGVDSWGNVCNKKNIKIPDVPHSGRDTRGKIKLFFFDETVLSNYVIGQAITYNKPSVCVTSCPHADISSYEMLKNHTQHTGISYCVYDYKLNGNASDANSCTGLPISKQKSILFRCVPSTVSAAYDFLIGFIDNILNSIDENFTQKCVSDLEKTWREICYLCAVGLGVSLVIVHLMRFIAGVIIWLSMFILGAGSVGGACLCWYYYYRFREDSTSTKWLIGSICGTTIMIIVLLILLIMRKRIGLVVELFKEAGKAIKDMPLLIFQPIWTFVCLVLELVCLIFFFSYILTSEHPAVNDSTGFVSFEKHDILKYLKWYYLLGSIWIVQFTLACDTIVISGAVSQWYFSRDKSLVRYPIIRSLRMLLRYHLGSAALGSLIITIVFAFRVFVNFIHNRLKNKTGSIVEFFLKCFGCCLWCFEKFISFLNSNAYVEIAITGYGFCHSARRAFKIVVGNALRLAAINSVGSFTLFLGKLAPLSVVIVLGLKLLANRGDIFYPWFPITISCIAAFIIASCFMGIYEKCIDTIFICFCEDHELNDGELKPYFMSLGLMKYVKSQSSNNVENIAHI
ncbi:choline transporter-like protein 1 [Mytilus trossulus]|uniref:choline transporter-like protein 1 n=1 Tax=Mytilus trossulus TaxID=6551 RepID=UPI0030062208